MGLSIGIVGLPNVGKSTLFNALSGAQVLAANYPFATKDPNVGIVPVPDFRLALLAKLASSKRILPAALEFVDIAGLVRGASKGEGLGNQFLANIREVDAIAHVLRCFKDGDVVHVEAGGVDPERDKEVVDTELCLKDLEALEKKRDRRLKESKAAGKPGEEAKADVLVYDKLKAALDAVADAEGGRDEGCGLGRAGDVQHDPSPPWARSRWTVGAVGSLVGNPRADLPPRGRIFRFAGSERGTQMQAPRPRCSRTASVVKSS